MHEDDGEPNTKSAVSEIWGMAEGKQEEYRTAYDRLCCSIKLVLQVRGLMEKAFRRRQF